MPDIAKINAVAIADIEKLDAVLAANIAKVNGLVFASAPVGAPAAAYSVRLLDTAVGVPTYTGAAMRVRRDTGGTGDDDEADIAFDTSLTDPAISLDSAISNASAGVTATTLGQFINVGTVNGTTYTNPDSLTVTASCYVNEWKDQSGNANDAEQTAQGSQPQIHNGTVNTDLITDNGKPALDFDGTNDGLEIDYTSTFTNISIWSVHAGTDGAVISSYPGSTPKNFLSQDMTSNAYRSIIRNTANTLKQVSTGTTSDTQVLHHTHYDRVNLGVAIDGGTLQTTAAPLTDIETSTAGIDIGQAPGTGLYLNGTTQEILLWNSDEASNRTAIETNINDFFSIY